MTIEGTGEGHAKPSIKGVGKEVKQKQWNKGPWAVLVVAMMALSGFAGGLTWLHATAPSPATASTTATGPSVGPASPSVAAATPSAAPAASASPKASGPFAASGPHPGTLQVYEPVPGGATSEDPAIAYDTTSYEVILNVYETLVSYNGTSTASMVPTLATCVPLQGAQCATDYGTGFTGVFNQTGKNFNGSNGNPTYWTFVIDPAAHFYDPATGKSWKVYPSDVMFSIARTLAWSTYPYVARTSGWILAQALLPFGNSSWDGGLHAPFNNTPSRVLGSMLVNASGFCPTSAMNGITGNGCITFVANGSSQDWPEFPQFVADNLGGSVVPCGWFTHEGASVPGWSGTHAAGGDGSCMLPDGSNATNTTSWTSYLASLSPTSWDSFIKLDANYPATQPNVQWGMVGSGPYYASVTPHLSYSLAANPAYQAPSGCTGLGGLATYVGYCDPAPGHYIGNVQVTWETAQQGDSLGINAIQAGTADFAGIYTTQTTTLLGFVASGLWQYNLFPTLSTAFTPINLAVDYSAYNTTFAGSSLHANPIPPTLFSDIGLRNFYINAYPYTTIQNTINTVAGVEYSFNAGGPIPVGMGNYYPSNVSWPYLRGDPTQPSSSPGSAAWWWAQLTDPSSPFYNKTIDTKCTSSSPCTWPIGYFNGAPANLVMIDDWAGEIYSLSDHRLSPWPLALTFTQFLSDTLVGPAASPLASAVGFGWAPDYPDPTDYMSPMAAPDGSYTGPDSFDYQLLSTAAHTSPYENNATCGHYGLSNVSDAYANLTYWVHQAQNLTITSACQGVAYRVTAYWMTYAGALSASPSRVLDYNLIEQITNALGMYVYNGQSNEVIGFAPWIDPSSVNENPVIGGGGDVVWYQVHYQGLYNVTVQESGLPTGTSWTATVGPNTVSSTSPSITFTSLPNATYNYSVGFESGYAVSPSNGTVIVNGADATKSVTYTAFTKATADVQFLETGLVSNTSWSLVVQNYGSLSTSSTALVFALPTLGTYTYQAQPVLGYRTPSAGSFFVGLSGVNVSVGYVGFFASTYNLTFEETGLPPGGTWSVTIGPPASAYTITASTPTIVFTETNGTYNFTLGVSSGFGTAQPKGSATLNGSSLRVLVEIGPTYTVTFTSSGLPDGTTWSVYFAGQEQNASAPSSISFSVVNGSWTYAASASGYAGSPGAGSLRVSGNATSVAVSFKSTAPAWTYLSTLSWILVAVLAVLAVVGFALAAIFRRRKPPAAAPPQSWSEEQTGPTGTEPSPPSGAVSPPSSGTPPAKT